MAVSGARLGEFGGAVFPGGVEVDLSEHVDQLSGDGEVLAAGRVFGVHNDNIKINMPFGDYLESSMQNILKYHLGYTQISFLDMFFLIFFLGGSRNTMKYSQGGGESDCFI